MNFLSPDVSQPLRELLPWFSLGHGVFNAVVMLLFCYQGWLGHLIRARRRAGKPPLATAMRIHRRNGPILVMLGVVGFLAGLILVMVDKGKVIAYPLHFSLGLTLVMTQLMAYAVSRTIRARETTGRQLHRLLGILLLCLFPLQVLVGLAILL